MVIVWLEHQTKPSLGLWWCDQSLFWWGLADHMDWTSQVIYMTGSPEKFKYDFCLGRGDWTWAHMKSISSMCLSACMHACVYQWMKDPNEIHLYQKYVSPLEMNLGHGVYSVLNRSIYSAWTCELVACDLSGGTSLGASTCRSWSRTSAVWSWRVARGNG